MELDENGSESVEEGQLAWFQTLESQSPKVPKPEEAKYEVKMELDIKMEDIVDHETDDPPSQEEAAQDPGDKYVIVLKKSKLRRYRFKCSICGKKSLSKNDVLKHIRIHTGHKPYKCEFCGAAFTQSTALRSHERIHSGEKPFPCSECHKKFSRKYQMKLHMRVHTGEKPYKCEHCNKIFARRSQLNYHMLSHTGGKQYKCPVDGSRFATQTRLDIHMSRRHSNKIALTDKPGCSKQIREMIKKELDDGRESIEEGKFVWLKPSEGQSPKPEKAEVKKEMETKMGDTVDQDTNDPLSEKVTMQNPGEKNMIVLKKIDERGNRFKCTICDKLSSTRDNMLRHVQIHKYHMPEKPLWKDTPFFCSECDKSFAREAQLKFHMILHTQEKSFKCEHCDNLFDRRSQLNLHMTIHAGEKPYKCPVDGSRFATMTSLDRHMKNHMGKEVKCCTCNKKYAKMSALYDHIRRVHEYSHPYTCKLCGKVFKGHQRVRQHMNLHLDNSPYKCSICSANFTQKTQLTVHMRTHTGERPFKCQICSAAFAHSNIFKIHMRTHTGEKPYQCGLCLAIFNQLPHLKSHVKHVHNATNPYICTTCKKYFQTKEDLQTHNIDKHNIVMKDDTENERILTNLRCRLAIYIYRISLEKQRLKFGFGKHLVDDVLKKLLKFSNHLPVNEQSLSPLEELRRNVMILLRWKTAKDAMDVFNQENKTVDDMLETLTCPSV